MCFQTCQVVHVEEVLDYISLFPDYRPGTGSIFYLARKYDETPQPSCARGEPAVRGNGHRRRRRPLRRVDVCEAESHSPTPEMVHQCDRCNRDVVDVGSSQDGSIIDLTFTGIVRVTGSNKED
ncbi:uncharacterized protein LOC123428475 [Hordeum vulgare subsp. vulgare]|uniref:uncharacterized protein LOC123428475 n=1 Tax=Hordeum vulgare subsp. vulgare TaxID=112509 RepID=UPI001D1A37F6|nr:uncharacterized protein LOC123428475 [Hordeum vulgare subsp. vulgare]